MSRRTVTLSLEAHGILSANQEIRLSPVSGRVAAVAADVGDTVSWGQPSLLEKDELEINVAQAEAVLMAARANLERVKAGARPEEIEQVRAQVAQAEANLEQARSNLLRLRALYEAGAVTQAQLEQAQSQFDVAQAAYTAAANQLELVLQGVRGGPPGRRGPSPPSRSRSGWLSSSFPRPTTSPLDGVADRLVNPNDIIGGPAGFPHRPDRPRGGPVEVGERDIIRARPGARAELTLDAFLPELQRHRDGGGGGQPPVPPLRHPHRSSPSRRDAQARHVGAGADRRRLPEESVAVPMKPSWRNGARPSSTWWNTAWPTNARCRWPCRRRLDRDRLGPSPENMVVAGHAALADGARVRISGSDAL